ADCVGDVGKALEVDLDVVVDVDVESLFQHVEHELRTAGSVRGVDAVAPRQPGDLHHQIARKRHDQRALRARLHVGDHQRVGVLAARIRSEGGSVRGRVDELTRVAADDQEVLTFGGRLRHEQVDPTDAV